MPRAVVGSLLVAVALSGSARAGDEPGGDKLNVTLENVTEGDVMMGRFVAHGTVPFLPKGTVLYVSLQVLGRSPPIEAAMLKIDCGDGGQYRVEHAFEGAVLAPIGYEARVVLHMEAQPKSIKDHLKRELGYRGNDVVALATRAQHVGNLEERVAYARTTLQTLLEHVERASKIHARVEAAKPAEWAQAKPPISTDLGTSYREFREWYEQFVCLYEHQLKQLVEQCYLGVDKAMMARDASDEAKAKRELNAVRDLVLRIRTDIESRLPKVEETTANPAANPEQATPEKEKKQ